MVWIGISGAHRVGKSTVLSDLEAKLGEEITVVRNVARGVIARGFQLGEKADVDSYVCLVAEYIKARSQVRRKKCPIVLFDRTILDTFSYCTVNLASGTRVQQHVIDLLDAIWSEEKYHFDHYFFVPVEFAATELNGVTYDEDYRTQVSDQILTNLELSGLSFTELRGSRADRLAILYRHIESYL
jgi:predicted ATPase